MFTGVQVRGEGEVAVLKDCVAADPLTGVLEGQLAFVLWQRQITQLGHQMQSARVGAGLAVVYNQLHG
jgi:hypothetical protein